MTRGKHAHPTRRSVRVGWGVADQALSSLTNFLVAFLVVRLVSTGEVGAFAVVNAVFLFVLAAFRAFAAKPFSIRLTTADVATQDRARADLCGLALVVGVAIGAPALLLGLATSGSLAGLLVLLGLGLPLLLVQDAMRFALVAEGRAEHAVASDVTWLVIQLAATGVVGLTAELTVGWLFSMWVAGGLGAAAVALRISHTPLTPSGARRFLSHHGGLGWRLGVEQSFTQGANQLAWLAIAAVLPLAALGSLRSAQVMLGPLFVLQQAAPMVGIPEARRQLTGRGFPGVVRVGSVVGAALAALSLALIAALLVVPDSLGEALFGDGWEAGRSLVVPLGLRNVLGSVTLGAVIALHTLERARTTMWLGVMRGSSGLIAALVAASVADIDAAAWALAASEGLAASAFVAALIWWRHRVVDWSGEVDESEPASATPLSAGQA